MSILTLEQAAEYLQITPADLREELEQGKIPGRQIAGQWRISRSALEHFLAQCEPVPNSTLPSTQVASDSLHSTLASADHGVAQSGASDNMPAEGTVTAEATATTDAAHDDKLLAPEAAVALPESAAILGTDSSATAMIEAVPVEDEEIGEERVPVPGNNREDSSKFVARIFVYNQQQGFGYAKSSDGKTIHIDSKYLVTPHPIPFPGDIIEFEWHKSRKGVPQARSIRVIEATSTTYPVQKATIEPPKQILEPKESKVDLYMPRHRPHPNGTRESERLYQLAALANTEGRYDEARKLFKRAIEAGGGVKEYAALAKSEREGGSRSEAIRILKEAIDRFPNQARFYIMHGQIVRSMRKLELAEDIFRNGLSQIPRDAGLRTNLAQTLVQIGSEAALREAGDIYAQLERDGKLNTQDRQYKRFQFLQRNPRANQVYDFFQALTNTKVSIPGQRLLPQAITDIVIETDDQELQESFGLSGAILVRCFQRPAQSAEIVNLKEYLAKLRNNELIGLSDGREVVLNRSLAFIAVPDSSKIRDQIMNILSESSEAIVPIDDSLLQTRNSENVLDTLRDLLGQYLGQRDLYNSTGPVYGVPGRRFFGRERQLVQLADDVYRGQFIGIYGLRKMGKTSLVYQLRDEKLSSDAVAYVDLQASHSQIVRDLAPLYYELENDLYRRLVRRDPHAAALLRLGKYDRYSELPEAAQKIALIFAEDMRAILDELKDGKITSFKRVVIVLDELERILPITGQEGIQGYLEFFGLIRGLMQTERYRGLLSSVVVAANASISERGYWQDRENPVFALYKTVFLPPFSEEETREMIVTLGRGMSVRWEDEAIHSIFAETGGHPFLTRLFCSRIIQNYRNRPLIVTNDMVASQINHFIRSEGDKMGQITELLQRNFPDEENYLEQIALDEPLESLPDEALRHLLGYHLIHAEGGRYRITLNLLRRWLRRRAGVKDE
ncbi:MAG: helix-turn-helix domain-containing protein [Candidatus Viridilinea halotolerans]|uniref:Helix-turn-helix domain-containing protein n=1 Tax=Candidatus Viridilinea halotolerans TaxID=2491704 RepID=A0A426UBS6_9CHLR|nr:MAG: helix-turn-helix domain-containing protein [Candidatus Viridilinea halotolerans]